MVTRPSSTFDIKINDADQTIKMSHALLQELLKVIPNPEEVAGLLVTDFHLREYVIRRVLTGNKRIKTEEDLVDLFDADADPDAIDDLVLWAVDHILYFFMNTAGKTLTLDQKYRPEIKRLTQSAQSQTGSQD